MASGDLKDLPTHIERLRELSRIRRLPQGGIEHVPRHQELPCERVGFALGHLPVSVLSSKEVMAELMSDGEALGRTGLGGVYFNYLTHHPSTESAKITAFSNLEIATTCDCMHGHRRCRDPMFKQKATRPLAGVAGMCTGVGGSPEREQFVGRFVVDTNDDRRSSAFLALGPFGKVRALVPSVTAFGINAAELGHEAIVARPSRCAKRNPSHIRRQPALQVDQATEPSVEDDALPFH